MGPPMKPTPADLVALRDDGEVRRDLEFVLEQNPEARRQLLEARLLALLLAPPPGDLTPIDEAPVDAADLMRYIGNDLAPDRRRALEARLKADHGALALLLDLRDAVTPSVEDHAPPRRPPEPTPRASAGTLRLHALGDEWLLLHVPPRPSVWDDAQVAASFLVAGERFAASRPAPESPFRDQVSGAARKTLERLAQISEAIAGISERIAVLGHVTRSRLEDGFDVPEREFETVSRGLSRLTAQLAELASEFNAIQRFLAEERERWQIELRRRRLRSEGWDDSVELWIGDWAATLHADRGRSGQPHLLVRFDTPNPVETDATVLVRGEWFQSHAPDRDGVLRLPLPDGATRVLLHLDQTYVLDLEFER